MKCRSWPAWINSSISVHQVTIRKTQLTKDFESDKFTNQDSFQLPILMILTKNKLRSKVKSMQTNFYTSSLIIESHLVSQGNLSLTFHYFKCFTKSLQDYSFQNQNDIARLLNPIRTSQRVVRTFLADLKSHKEYHKCLREIKPWWWHSLANQEPNPLFHAQTKSNHNSKP